MFKEIRNQLYKMSFVLFLLGALGVWQWNFVITAINSNVFLNLTIFGAFGFGVFAAYKNVLGLKNEVHAFHALQEDYDDRCNNATQEANDPYWRYYRCEEDAIVFQKPHVLEHPFQIISEEIGRTNTLAMSTGTMQNLSDSVDAKISDQRSLVQYVTGILVMLGLIGTFVGLMVTLSSVGAIIGNLDLTGGAGAAAIQGLMDGLKVPLQGMATGFSSSLFGLITSLALGLMSRFANQASDILKSNFETWLAGVAIVGEGNSTQNPGGHGFQERQLDLMFRVARFSLISNSRMMTTVDSLTEASHKLIDVQGSQLESTATLTHAVSQMLQSQDVVNRSLIQTNEVLEDRQQLASVMDELRQDTANQMETYQRVNNELGSLAARQSDIQEASATALAQLASRNDLNELLSLVDHKMSEDSAEFRNSLESVARIVSEIDAVAKDNKADDDIHKGAIRSDIDQMRAVVEQQLRPDMANVKLSIESVAKIVEAIDTSTRERQASQQHTQNETSMVAVEPLIAAVTEAITQAKAAEAARIAAEAEVPTMPENEIRSSSLDGDTPLTVQEMRSMLHRDFGAEETDAQAQERQIKVKPSSSLGRIFGRGR